MTTTTMRPKARGTALPFGGLLLGTLLLGTVLLGPGAGFALAREPVESIDARDAVAILDGVLSDATMTWDDRWPAYQVATDALTSASGDVRAEAAEAYERIRRKVATFLLRAETPDAPTKKVTEALDAVRALDAVVGDADAAWRKKWAAYTKAKKALKGLGDEKGPYKDVPAAAYGAIQRDTADALRRENLGVNGWILGFLAASILWGGMAVTVTIAMRSTKQAKDAAAGA